MNQTTLSAMADFLNQGGLNYTVFLRAYSMRHMADQGSSQLISHALGKPVVIREIGDVSTEAMVSDITDCLSYAGDEGAGPAQAAVASDHFAELLRRVIADAKSASSQAHRIEQFRLEAGHPAYPVFWAFAFLFTSSHEATVLVGSSSD
jgi:hypothetical protein